MTKLTKSRFAVLTLSLVIIVTTLSLAILEILAQGAYLLLVVPHLDKIRQNNGHYYSKSANSLLIYELTPGFEHEELNRKLRINSLGMRDEEVQDASNTVRLALLGDSITFGVGITQSKTISSLLQQELVQNCGAIRVLNFGVPGYAAWQLQEHLRNKADLAPVDAVIYLLNLNDFSRHNSIYAGADNGLATMYDPPVLKLPWFIRKAIYRWMKGGKFTITMTASERWYRWMFEGTKEQTIDDVIKMKDYSLQNGMEFVVFIVPAGVAYKNQSYALSDLHDELGEILVANNIAVLDPVETYKKHSPELFDKTDHFTEKGNNVTARVLRDFFYASMPDIAAKAKCRS